MRLCTHPHPIDKDGNELCDCSMVFGPHIIISIKEIKFRDTDDTVD